MNDLRTDLIELRMQHGLVWADIKKFVPHLMRLFGMLFHMMWLRFWWRGRLMLGDSAAAIAHCASQTMTWAAATGVLAGFNVVTVALLATR